MNTKKNTIVSDDDLKTITNMFKSLKGILQKYGEIPDKSKTDAIEAQSKFKSIFEMDIRDTQINTLTRRLEEALYNLLTLLATPDSEEDLNKNSVEFDNLIVLLKEYLQKLKKEAIQEGILNLKEYSDFLEEESKTLQKTSNNIKEDITNMEESHNSQQDNENLQAKSNQELNYKEKTGNSNKVSSTNIEDSEKDSINSQNNDVEDSDVLEIKNIIKKRKENLHKIEARKKDSKGNYNIDFNITSNDFFDLEIESEKYNKNKIPIKGVLFEFDKPSEEIPSVGPNMPLYIPRNVAEKIQGSVIGYPLDADPSLSKHQKSNIVGVIENAYTSENRFIIEGNLWFNNKEAQIQKIISQKENLGLSMNADASGHIQEIDGQRVFYIDDLSIWGANILYLDLATYQQAKILAKKEKSNQDSLNQKTNYQAIEDGYAIKAKKSDLEDNKMDESTKAEILTTLKSLHESFNEQQKIQAEKNKSLEEDLDSIKNVVKKYEEERQQVEAQKQQETSQKQKEEDQKQLIEAIKSEMESMISEQIDHIKNPSREPKRKTKSQSTHNKEEKVAVSSEVRNLQLQLSKIQGALEHAQNLPFEKQLALQEEKTQLENKLSLLS